MDQPGTPGTAGRLSTCPGSQNEIPLSSASADALKGPSSAIAAPMLDWISRKLDRRSDTARVICSPPALEITMYNLQIEWFAVIMHYEKSAYREDQSLLLP
jgi:hypothetical protein